MSDSAWGSLEIIACVWAIAYVAITFIKLVFK